MLLTLLSAMTQGSTGFATLYTSTESSVDSPLLERNTEVCVERVTAITKHDLQEGLPGRGTIHCLSVVTVNAHRVLSGTNIIILLDFEFIVSVFKARIHL